MIQKKTFLLIGAVVLILFLFAALTLSAVPDLFSSDTEDSGITVENATGDISIRRRGSNYTLKNGVALYPGDEIMMGRNAQCEVIIDGRARITLDRDSRLAIRELTDSRAAVEVLEGAAFFDLIRSEPENVMAVETALAELDPATGAVFSVEAYTGTQTVDLYEGKARLSYEGQIRDLKVGSHVTMVQTDEKNIAAEAGTLASELRQFLLEELIARGGLCFEPGQLRQIIADRASDAKALADTQPNERSACTVEIRCDTALDHRPKGSFTPPGDGVMLPATQVKFTPGESAYDVLRRVCKTAGLSLDYNYYPMIGGYYVTEIGGLTDTEYGKSAGWLYKVNGWFPNYSASKHEVEAGDVIMWVYTCEGGGADLGREEWDDQPFAG